MVTKVLPSRKALKPKAKRKKTTEQQFKLQQNLGDKYTLFISGNKTFLLHFNS